MIALILWNVATRLVAIDTNKTRTVEHTIDMSYLIDPSGKMDVDNIKKQLSTFIPAKNNEIPFELSKQTYWLRIIVKNHSAEPLALVLYADNNMLDILKVYQANKTITSETNYLSTNLLANNHDISLKVYPHLTFDLPARQNKAFILEIQTQGPPNVPLMVISNNDFTQRVLYAQIFYGAFIGIILLMAMYNLVLFFAIKDTVYLFYIGYLLSSFMVLSGLTGFGHLIFSTEIQALINKYIIFLHYYIVIFLVLFTLFFLRYNQGKNKTYRAGKAIIAILIFCSLLSINLDAILQAKLFFSLQPFTLLFAIFVLLKRINHNYSWSKFYLLSWLPLLIGSSIQPLVLLNYLDYSFFTRNAFLVAIIVELTLMAFALAQRMKRNEQDRIKDIAYHITSGLPRKSNLETFVNQLVLQKDNQFTLLMIKPEHIDKIALYIDDEQVTQLFQHLFQKLSLLFQFNDSVFSLTENNEKLCFINNNAFVIVINDKYQHQTLEELIAAIQKIVSDNFQINHLKLPLSAIIGASSFPEHGIKSHQLINNVIFATNQAELNHQKWALYQQQSSNENAYLLQLTSDLKSALENDNLAIFHQPQIDLRTLRVCSSECLIRWQHPTQGFISPSVFIPVAEDMGLINEITLWVIEKSLQQQLLLASEYGFNHMISINISGKDIASEHFFTRVIDIIENSTIPADKIIFELTESSSITYNEESLELIEKLVDLGITISIDDFGTGYSSMSQISNLPFQELKVDREFVENINDNLKRKIIAEATVKMAKGLGLEVVAEGVNSQQDEDTLRRFGCDIGQGYFYAKPMAIDDYISWLENLDNGRIKQPMQGEFIPAEK